MSVGQKVILVVGSFVITFITICTFFKSDISFLLTSRKVERKYGNTSENIYYLIDNYEYVNEYSSASINSRKEIVDSIYYLLNSGVSYSERYCSRDYSNCYADIESVSSSANSLSLLNNFVHPFNSFESIIFNFDENIMKVQVKHTYSNEEISLLNNKVDEIIKENIKSEMTPREKIKVIHDYIINNTSYDTLKTDNTEDKTYRSNTAYGVLFEGYGICSGYSDAMKLFLDKLNIINYKISNDEHIWNLVYLDGQWLHLDLTWDDPVSDKNITRDNYFLITSDTLEKLDDDVHKFDSRIFVEAK